MDPKETGSGLGLQSSFAFTHLRYISSQPRILDFYKKQQVKPYDRQQVCCGSASKCV